jgi:hypothetical protein
MAIHWQIPFKSLRSGTVYTVNIYDPNYSHYAGHVVLKGGAQPFVTQEDDDEDFFANIRTQSGYIRIVDDGKDSEGNTFNWKTFVPTTDTDRPVTVTDGNGGIVWQGFMQAQNFNGILYGNPQEREFPLQCALSVLEGSDIDITHRAIENFAYLLRDCVNEVDRLSGGTVSQHQLLTSGSIHIDTIYIQGGSDAIGWMLKRIDWQNFVTFDNDEIKARYTLYQILEDVCRFWGFTARTFGQNLYLVRPDDLDIQDFAVLTRAQLNSLASGTDESTSGLFSTVALAGNEFATCNNVDFRQRGHNKSIVSVDDNGSETENIIELDEKIEETMEGQGWNSQTYIDDDMSAQYTNDLLTFTRLLVTGTCLNNYGAFVLGQIGDISESKDTYRMVRIKKSYNASVASSQAYAQLTTVFHHAYSEGFFQIHGTVYRYSNVFRETMTDKSEWGKKTMYMRLGVGKDRNSAVWFNGNTWSSAESTFKASIGNSGKDIFALNSTGNFARKGIPAPDTDGLLFVEILGSDDLDDIDGEKSFEIADFTVEYYKYISPNGGSASRAPSNRPKLPFDMKYTSQNGNNVRNEWNADCIYASDNDMAFGYGLIINPDGTFTKSISYNGVDMHPEQQLADRVTAYWQTARRKVSVEMMSNVGNVPQINPQKQVTLDSMNFYPIAISRDWRDDITEITMLELPTS